jgi:predicted metal-dependent hydrolase
MDKIQIVRSMRRSLSIQILPDATIKVSAPYLFPRSQIEKFLRDKADWIAKHQQMVLARSHDVGKEGYWYLGKRYPVELRLKQKTVVEVADKIYIATSSKKYIKTYLTSWYKQQARKIILERVHHYSRISGLSYKSVGLTSATTRWGSCSSQKTLNFNWKLIMSPLPVLDYVVCHELAHLVELNHSRDFWETVRKMFPIYRQYRTWLKRYGHTLTI